MNAGAPPIAADLAPEPAGPQARAEAPAAVRERPWVLGSVAGACVAVFVALGCCVRPQADDWVWALRTRDLGWFGAQSYTYRECDGHFLATFLQTALGLGDPVVIARIGAALIVAAFAGAAVAFARAVRPEARNVASAVALMAVAGYCGTAVARETFFWYCSAVTYPLAAALVMAGAASVLNGLRAGTRWRHALIGGGAFMACAGCGETIVPLAGLLVAWGWLRQWRVPGAHRAWGACAAGLAVGTAALVLAPGNGARLQGLGGMHPLPEAIVGAIAFALHAVWALACAPIAITGAALVAPFAGRVMPRVGWTALAGMVALALAGSALAVLPVLMGYGHLVDRVCDLARWWQWLWLLAAWCALCARLPGAAIPSTHAASPPTAGDPDARPAPRPAAGGFAPGPEPVAGAVCVVAVVAAVICCAEGLGTWVAWSIVALAALAGAVGGRVRPLVRAFLLVAFAVLCLGDAGPDLCMRMPRWLAVWHQRDLAMATARAHHERLAVLPSLPDDAYPKTLVLAEITANPHYLWTTSMADWYGLREIWLDSGLPADNPLRRPWDAQIRARARQLGQTTIGGEPIPPAPGPAAPADAAPAPPAPAP